MVRVTSPPGGASRLHSEEKPRQKTVRVLKPPGGGSSISFTDDDAPRTSRYGPQATPSQKDSEPSTPETPVEASQVQTPKEAAAETPKELSSEAPKEAPAVESNAPASATTTTTAAQNAPPAGQRQRIPPGGFSTKLW